jgi:cytochrome bd ubiquinol oxidase subunit I
MSIGLAFYMFVMEAMWLKTGKEYFYRQVRFWSKIFVLTFAIGVASGFPLVFQFGTNWAAFAAAAGNFFGNLIGFETTISFTLETAALGIFIFGWNRVSRPVHFISNFFVFLGTFTSAFWIMTANSWMQIPLGTHLAGGITVVDSYSKAILNPETLVSFTHMILASFETTLFMLGGIAAWQLLKNDRASEVFAFYRRTLLYVLVLVFAVAPLQVIMGDQSGLNVAKYQPEKLAATELVWNTNTPGTSVPWTILAWPNSTNNGNAFEFGTVPYALSLLTSHSLTSTIQGLNDFPADDRPTPAETTTVFYAFRVMIAIGFFMLFLALGGAWLWWKGKLSLETIANNRWFLRSWVFAIPLGFLAVETGWMVREIGRQPWMIYHALRISDSLSSNLNLIVVVVILIAIVAIYLTLISLFIVFALRTIKKGPDLTSPLPSPTSY